MALIQLFPDRIRGGYPGQEQKEREDKVVRSEAVPERVLELARKENPEVLMCFN